MSTYRCTECDATFPTLAKASRCHWGIGGVEEVTPRPLYEIAAEITADWKPVWFGAVPYVEAMGCLTSLDQMYGMESGRIIVSYFLSNAKLWRGDTAKRIKRELRAILDA